ncbi:MAG: hypothetical protein WDO16_00475 [Bacteroidota bacterium]
MKRHEYDIIASPERIFFYGGNALFQEILQEPGYFEGPTASAATTTLLTGKYLCTDVSIRPLLSLRPAFVSIAGKINKRNSYA